MSLDLEHRGQVIVRTTPPHAEAGCLCGTPSTFAARIMGLPGKPVQATPGAKEHFTDAVIRDAVLGLAVDAEQGTGLCWQQIYRDSQTGRELWILEEPDAILVMLPEEY